MYFKADYDKLSDISRASLNQCNELNDIFADMIQICKDVEANWVSQDSSIYLDRMKSYLEDAVKENDSLLKGAFCLNKVAILYGAQDDKWEEELLKSSLVDDKFFRKED